MTRALGLCAFLAAGPCLADGDGMIAVYAVVGVLGSSTAVSAPLSACMGDELRLSSRASTVGARGPRRLAFEDCQDTSECADGYVCREAKCQGKPGEADARPLRERALELYLATRATTLREQLALGRGTLLAVFGGPDVARTLRSHRAELIGLIDGSDRWTSRFLQRVQALTAA